MPPGANRRGLVHLSVLPPFDLGLAARAYSLKLLGPGGGSRILPSAAHRREDYIAN